MSGAAAAATGMSWKSDLSTEAGPISALLRCLLAVLRQGGYDFSPLPYQAPNPTARADGGVDMGRINTVMNTYLHGAVSGGVCPMVRFAIAEAGQDPNARSPAASKSPPLVLAAAIGHAPMVRLLLQLGADPLLTAVDDGSGRSSNALQNLQAITAFAPPNSYAAQMVAARGGQHAECERLLLAAMEGRPLDGTTD